MHMYVNTYNTLVLLGGIASMVPKILSLARPAYAGPIIEIRHLMRADIPVSMLSCFSQALSPLSDIFVGPLAKPIDLIDLSVAPILMS